jgi:hypothetical protein
VFRLLERATGLLVVAPPDRPARAQMLAPWPALTGSAAGANGHRRSAPVEPGRERPNAVTVRDTADSPARIGLPVFAPRPIAGAPWGEPADAPPGVSISTARWPDEWWPPAMRSAAMRARRATSRGALVPVAGATAVLAGATSRHEPAASDTPPTPRIPATDLPHRATPAHHEAPACRAAVATERRPGPAWQERRAGRPPRGFLARAAVFAIGLIASAIAFEATARLGRR